MPDARFEKARLLLIPLAIFLFLTLTPLNIYSQENIDAKEIIRRMDLLLRGDTSFGIYEMTITDPNWKRSLKLKVWEVSKDKKTFIRILSPHKEKGIGTLKIKNEMWNYLPRVERIIKIPPSMMMQSWMGSDFTNDDLVKESSIIDDYFHKVLREERFKGFDAYRVELLPKPDAPVVWGKIVTMVRKGDFVPLQHEFFNERGELIRVMTFSDIRKVGGRTLPTYWEMVPLKKKGKKTALKLIDIKFDLPLKRSIFTMKNLKKVR